MIYHISIFFIQEAVELFIEKMSFSCLELIWNIDFACEVLAGEALVRLEQLTVGGVEEQPGNGRARQ